MQRKKVIVICLFLSIWITAPPATEPPQTQTPPPTTNSPPQTTRTPPATRPPQTKRLPQTTQPSEKNGCQRYTFITDGTRLNTNPYNSPSNCDYNLDTKWYRFFGRAGNRMPESAPPINHCGTNAPGWLNGKHPSEAQGSVRRQVCYHWNNNICLWSNEIQVTNCGHYFVYKLGPTPDCILRYCSMRKTGNTVLYSVVLF